MSIFSRQAQVECGDEFVGKIAMDLSWNKPAAMVAALPVTNKDPSGEGAASMQPQPRTAIDAPSTNFGSIRTDFTGRCPGPARIFRIKTAKISFAIVCELNT